MQVPVDTIASAVVCFGDGVVAAGTVAGNSNAVLQVQGQRAESMAIACAYSGTYGITFWYLLGAC